MSQPTTTRTAFYGMALAQAHADAFNGTFAAAHPWLAAQIAASGTTPFLFDIGCGDGYFLAEMAKLGLPGEGIDISAAFVSLAKRRGLDVRQESAMTARAPDGTTAITALGEVLAYDPAALAPAALYAARALPAGGVFLFDLPGPKTPATRTTAQGDGWTLDASSEVRGKILKREIEMRVGKQKVHETHLQHLFDPDEVLSILSGFGFQAEASDRFGPAPLLPGRVAFHARKP